MRYVGNKTLLDHSIEQAKSSDIFDEIWISADFRGALWRAWKHRINFLRRPDWLAKNDSTLIDVARNAISELDFKGSLVILLPTYPLRQVEHIRQAVSLLETSEASSVLCKYPATEHPNLTLIDDRPILPLIYRRQDRPAAYIISHYVVAVKCEKTTQLDDGFYNSSTKFLEIDKPIDIDTEQDLIKCQNIYNMMTRK